MVTQRCGQYESDEETGTWVVCGVSLAGATSGVFCYYSECRRPPSIFVMKSEED
ncbi:hypothetical protein [Methanofollis sp. W23]|uniref:hypothetical protein n=1 Tax=Methanofollis sp. W23 TaxID=2817849 RepID=UPI001AE5BC40|nr:hypothetical protein [Methanofollis sp. W23]